METRPVDREANCHERHSDCAKIAVVRARGGKVAFTAMASAREGTQKTTMIHIFGIYSKTSFGSLPNLFFRAKAGSLIVPVLILSRRNALHSGGVGGAAACSILTTRVFNRLHAANIPVPVADQSPFGRASRIDFSKALAFTGYVHSMIFRDPRAFLRASRFRSNRIRS